MNIIEEQNVNGGTNPDVTGNMESHPVPPSAKKVYSKPTLVVLNQNDGTRNKQSNRPVEQTPAPFPFTSQFFGPS
jgi:hypothetical protein